MGVYDGKPPFFYVCWACRIAEKSIKGCMAYYNLARHMSTTVSIPCNKDFANTVVSILREHEADSEWTVMRMFAYDPRTNELGINVIKDEPDVGYDIVKEIFHYYGIYQITYSQIHGHVTPYFTIQTQWHTLKISVKGKNDYHVGLYERSTKTPDGEILFRDASSAEFDAISIKDIASNPVAWLWLNHEK